MSNNKKVFDLINRLFNSSSEDDLDLLLIDIARCNDNIVIDLITPYMLSVDAVKRKLVSRILGNIGSISTRNVSASEIEENSNDSMNYLLDMLSRENDISVIESIVYSLGKIKKKDMLISKKLEALIEHPDPSIRTAVAFTLGKNYLDDFPIGNLVTLSDDKNSEVRNMAVFSITNLIEFDNARSSEFRKALLNRVKDKDPETRAHAYLGLAILGEMSIIPYVIDDLDNEKKLYDDLIEASFHLADRSLVPSLERIRNEFPDWIDVNRALSACKSTS